jgi:hypothetical protein
MCSLNSLGTAIDKIRKYQSALYVIIRVFYDLIVTCGHVKHLSYC